MSKCVHNLSISWPTLIAQTPSYYRHQFYIILIYYTASAGFLSDSRPGRRSVCTDPVKRHKYVTYWIKWLTQCLRSNHKSNWRYQYNQWFFSQLFHTRDYSLNYELSPPPLDRRLTVGRGCISLCPIGSGSVIHLFFVVVLVSRQDGIAILVRSDIVWCSPGAA